MHIIAGKGIFGHNKKRPAVEIQMKKMRALHCFAELGPLPFKVERHLALQLPTLFELPTIIIVQLAALWLSARYALPFEDRKTLGKTARKLKLV